MLRSSLRFAPLLLVLGAVQVSGLEGQVTRSSAALGVSRVSEVNGELRYEYHLTHNGRMGDVWWDLNIDVSQPKPAKPYGKRSQGRDFLFDAAIDYPDNVIAWHAPISVTIPSGWFSSLTYHAQANWTAASYGTAESTEGVRYGQRRDGFALQSPALPAFREWHVVPWRMFPNSDDPIPTEADTTYVFERGYILAPGWMPEEVTALFLQEQVEGACFLRAFSGCAEYRRLAAAVAVEETKVNDTRYKAALRIFGARMDQDQALTQTGRLVLAKAVNALYRRPPSKRSSAPTTR